MIQPNPRPTAPFNPWLATAAIATAIVLAAPTSNLLTQAVPTASADDSLHVTPTGQVGIGTNDPARQFHMVGGNAVFRMDRSNNSAAFLLVRTEPDGTPMKTFVVGARATGTNDGELVINDLGTAVSGPGERRMTITNNGEIHFTGTVHAPDFVSTSSARFKEDIRTVRDASRAIQNLRGVRFTWKDSGQPSLGLIAEEVQHVLPELVKTENDHPAAVNYQAMVAVLVEALKEQQALIHQQEQRITGQQSRLDSLERQQDQLDSLRTRLEDLESLVDDKTLTTATLSEHQ